MALCWQDPLRGGQLPSQGGNSLSRGGARVLGADEGPGWSDTTSPAVFYLSHGSRPSRLRLSPQQRVPSGADGSSLPAVPPGDAGGRLGQRVDLPFCDGDVQAAEQLQRLPDGEGDGAGGGDIIES